MSAALKQPRRERGMTHDLSREMEAARLVAAQIADLSGNDPEFIRDAIEGETSLLEVVGAVAASLLDDQALCEAIDAHKGRLDARKERLENRIELKRALMASALELAERPKLETPAATVSLRAVPPKVDVVVEADIPAEFWRPQPPKLDRKAVLEALKAARPVPGARLTNGSITVSVRP